MQIFKKRKLRIYLILFILTMSLAFIMKINIVKNFAFINVNKVRFLGKTKNDFSNLFASITEYGEIIYIYKKEKLLWKNCDQPNYNFIKLLQFSGILSDKNYIQLVNELNFSYYSEKNKDYLNAYLKLDSRFFHIFSGIDLGGKPPNFLPLCR